ncbi:hypothetical protein ACFCV3_14090 [Kribbella sp. NPDC056345]|uniref:hypothetical protein n=1 Tax=Kribbella sp. NPDC056345 TaxID=3345789 RepID=UPI0035DDBF26
MDGPRGTEIWRHEAHNGEWVAPAGQRPGVDEAIDRHIQTHFGPIDFVLHEVVGHLVTVHVYVIAPTAERPYQTLITSGMSERPMAVPLKLSQGTDALIAALDRGRVTELLDPARPSFA